MGKKWAGNLNEELKKDKSKTAQKRVSNGKKSNGELYKSMISSYDVFCNKQIGMGAKIDGLQGKSMKLIISYLQSQVIKKQGDLSQEDLDHETLKAWEFILSKWNKLNNFYKEQIKLSQINSNLPNILTQIRNTNKKQRDEKFASTVNEIDGISFSETEQ